MCIYYIYLYYLTFFHLNTFTRSHSLYLHNCYIIHVLIIIVILAIIIKNNNNQQSMMTTMIMMTSHSSAMIKSQALERAAKGYIVGQNFWLTYTSSRSATSLGDNGGMSQHLHSHKPCWHMGSNLSLRFLDNFLCLLPAQCF